MSTEKAELARAGTMQVTAKEGKTYLEKNLTEWKKPYLLEEGEEEGGEEEEAPPAKKTKLAKHTTMKGTAKEAERLLQSENLDQDGVTRGQQKLIAEIQAEKPAAKKGRMARAGTMANTAKEGKALVGSEKLGETRGETKSRKSKGSMGRATTIDKVTAEAKLIYGDLPASEGRSMRKRPSPPPAKAPLKKKGTMVQTAKEGKAYLKNARKQKKNKDAAAEEDDA